MLPFGGSSAEGGEGADDQSVTDTCVALFGDRLTFRLRTACSAPPATRSVASCQAPSPEGKEMTWPVCSLELVFFGGA